MGEIEQVLANWIQQATSSPGQLAPGTPPAKWAAEQFINWWRSQVEDSLGDAERSAQAVREELERLAGWSNEQLGRALEELTHLGDVLGDLRKGLRLDGCR
jgi:hypothetical protein